MKPVEIVKDTVYPEMYRLKWEDGVLSEDFYNLTRASDILRNYDEYRLNMKKSEEMLALWRAENHAAEATDAKKLKRRTKVKVS